MLFYTDLSLNLRQTPHLDFGDILSIVLFSSYLVLDSYNPLLSTPYIKKVSSQIHNDFPRPLIEGKVWSKGQQDSSLQR